MYVIVCQIGMYVVVYNLVHMLLYVDYILNFGFSFCVYSFLKSKDVNLNNLI